MSPETGGVAGTPPSSGGGGAGGGATFASSPVDTDGAAGSVTA